MFVLLSSHVLVTDIKYYYHFLTKNIAEQKHESKWENHEQIWT
jgi:hypothetical protein